MTSSSHSIPLTFRCAKCNAELRYDETIRCYGCNELFCSNDIMICSHVNMYYCHTCYPREEIKWLKEWSDEI
jgi:hypothetical protein